MVLGTDKKARPKQLDDDFFKIFSCLSRNKSFFKWHGGSLGSMAVALNLFTV